MIQPAINIQKIEPYKAGLTIEEVKKKYNLKKIIKLASNENSFGPSPKVIEKLKNFSQKAYIYPDGNSSLLKEKISSNIGLKSYNIILGNGSNEIIELIYRTYLNSGDKIISCYPTFSFYKICASTTNAKFLEVPLLNYKFNLNGILNNIDNKVKIVIICNPNNPTGTIVENFELETFIKEMPDNVLIVLDEAYIEFVNKNKNLDSINIIKKYPEKSIIILRTFSKLYGLASLRIGYGISNKIIIDHLNRVRQPFNVNGFAQVAALEALNDIEYANFVINKINEGKKFIYSEMEKLNVDFIQSETNFIFFKLNRDNNYIFDEFLKRGVIIRSLKSFGYNKALRVTIGTQEENKIFIDVLKEILIQEKL